LLPSSGSNVESRILHNEDLRVMYMSPSSITLRSTGYVDRIEKSRNAGIILMRENYRKHIVWTAGRRLEDKIKIYIG
jgi:hypothetical protein